MRKPVIAFVMTIEKIRELRHSKPFKPFLIRLANGQKVKVQEAFNMALSPTGTYVVVFGPNGDYHHIDLESISEITLGKNSGRATGGRK